MPRTWIGGNVDWVDGGSTANWNPADEPDSDDEAIFNTANTVNLGSNNAVNGLTLSGGIDLFANDFDLTIDGLAEVGGSGTNLFINGAAGSINADDVTINANGTIELRGGRIDIDEEVGTSLIDINVDGNLIGNGLIQFEDLPGVPTLMLVNDGEITALSRGVTIFSPPPVGTLTITDSNANGRIDLDGAGEAGVVNVNRNQTLATDMFLQDAFNGDLNLSHNSTFHFNPTFTLGAGGTIDVDNGFVAGGLGFSDILADTSYIETFELVQTGGAINVVDTDGTLQIDGAFTMSGGTFANSGTAIFNGTTSITTAAGYTPSSLNAQTIVNANMTINDGAGNFNWDGSGVADTTVNNGSLLSITANQVDTTDNVFGGDVILNDASDLTVNVAATSWTLGGALTKNDAGTSSVNGDRIVITGHVTANAGTLDMSAVTTSASANVDAVATVTFGGASELAGGNLHGAGLLRMEGTSVVLANTTIDVATFDWDGLGTGTSHTINTGVVFTINSAALDSDGDMDDPFTLAGAGSQLIVNNTNGLTQWTVNGTVTANASGVGTSTIGGTSRMIVAGLINVDGNTTISAPATLGASSTAAIDAATTLRLAGGNTTDAPNRIEGGFVNGPGVLAADAGKALEGFGTINSTIDFDGASNLFADDGTLTINGAIVDVNRIGAADDDGVLNVVNAWNSSVTSFLTLNGGTIQGGTITIDNVNGLSGFGTVASRIINNTGVRASGGTLVMQTAGNDNDWDGAANNASLHANPDATLELRDNATFGFAGTVSLFPGARVFTNGFALDFNPGSSLFLNSGAKYESTSSTDLGGVVTTSSGPASRIKVANNFFLTFESTSSTTLVANLELENNNINIDAGATFAGGGALVVLDGSHLAADNLSNIGVLLDMKGAFRPGNFDGIGRIDLFDYQQASSGELYVELTGTALNAYDRLVASGTAVIDGYLNIDIDGGFIPSLGNTFNILTAAGGVIGQFDTIDVSGMPAGLAFHVEYLANAVQLQVVNKPLYSADFDEDGDVDATDLAIWKGAYDLNQLGDADGDNDSDGNDFLLWQRQFGSVPAVIAAQPAAGAVPEPSGALLVLLAAIGLRRSSRR